MFLSEIGLYCLISKLSLISSSNLLIPFVKIDVKPLKKQDIIAR